MTESYEFVFRNSVLKQQIKLDLGCLHPVASVRSGDGGFYPSTQRRYRRLYFSILLHSFYTEYWHNRAPASGEYTITPEDGRVRPKHVDD
jgi:hypothetical protein